MLGITLTSAGERDLDCDGKIPTFRQGGLPKDMCCQVSFDVFVFALVLMNAVNRPYRETSEVVSNLKKDGIVFFMVCLISLFSYALWPLTSHQSFQSILGV